MFCTNCGNNIEDGNKFCPYCGTPIKNNNINETMLFTNTAIPAQQMQSSMKWYKFVIYFQLFAGALMNIASLGSVIEDKLNYKETKKEILEFTDFESAYYNEMLDIFDKTDIFLNICVVLAICSALTAVLAIVTRQKLAHYKKEGPKLLLIYYGLGLGINLAIALTGHIFLSKPVLDTAYNFSQIYGFIIGGIVMVICNKIYFKKREYMFNN